jgi:peptidoglycan/LPS O-acetylase OafA/YrhL
MLSRVPKFDSDSSQGIQNSHRFAALDLLRGIAAIVVMCFHFGYFFSAPLFPHGYLAVDFFFMLSGFVLASAYSKRLDEGWSTSAFLRVRLIRLYPMYLLGLLIGFAFTVSRSRFGLHWTEGQGSTLLVLWNLFCLPALFGAGNSSSYLFPFDIPAWSLFYELAINIVHAALLRRRSPRFLLTMAVISALMLCGVVWKYGAMNVGADRAEVAYGLIRVSFSYPLGILLFQFWKRRWVPGSFGFACAALMLVLWGLPVLSSFPRLYDCIVTLTIFPIILLAGASVSIPKGLTRPSLLIGNASYAIYILHVPLADWFQLILAL